MTMQDYFWKGTLSGHVAELKASEGYRCFMEIAEGATYGHWIPIFLENAVPYTAGFHLENGIITAVGDFGSERNLK